MFLAACKSEGLTPVQEMVFGTELNVRFRADYFFEGNNNKVAVEIDGGVWNNGRHNRASGYIEGMEKRNAYTLLKIHQLVFTVQEIEKKPISIIRAVKNALGLGIDAKFVFDSLYKENRAKRAKTIQQKRIKNYELKKKLQEIK